mmetsp:Transcript_37754/g.87249  ORF Transcript_37754/g.87249 Transcript_37754/m.87249 type:complete len:484 (-) Transcript_37754:144-1595(-)
MADIDFDEDDTLEPVELAAEDRPVLPCTTATSKLLKTLSILAAILQVVMAVSALSVWFNLGTVYRLVLFDDCQQAHPDDDDDSSDLVDCELFSNSSTRIAQVMNLAEDEVWSAKFISVMDDSPLFSFLSKTPPPLPANDTEHGLDEYQFGWLVAFAVVASFAALLSYVLLELTNCSIGQRSANINWLSPTGIIRGSALLIGATILEKVGKYIVNVMTSIFTSMSCESDVEGSGVYSAPNLEPAQALYLLFLVPLLFVLVCFGASCSCWLRKHFMGKSTTKWKGTTYCSLTLLVMVVGIAAFVYRLVSLEPFRFFILGFFTGVGGPCVFRADPEMSTVQALLIVVLTCGLLTEIIGYTQIVLVIIGLCDTSDVSGAIPDDMLQAIPFVTKPATKKPTTNSQGLEGLSDETTALIDNHPDDSVVELSDDDADGVFYYVEDVEDVAPAYEVVDEGGGDDNVVYEVYGGEENVVYEVYDEVSDEDGL